MSPAAPRPLATRLASVLDEIAAEPDPQAMAGLTPAAVLVVLRDPQAEGRPAAATRPQVQPVTADHVSAEGAAPFGALGRLRVLLTRRRAQLRRHAGEVAFPGGRRDDSDGSLLETALREAEEEIGLARERVLPLGALGVAHTLSTNYAVYPVVALLRDGPRPEAEAAAASRQAAGQERSVAARTWRLSEEEVESVLELSLDELEGGRARQRLTRRGFTFETDVFQIGEDLIWGLTQRVIDDLLQRVQRAA